MSYLFLIWIVSLGLVLYIYGGYLGLLFLLEKLSFLRLFSGFGALADLPVEDGYKSITVIVAAHNEESSITERLKNLSDCSYRGALEVIVVSDGSTDATIEAARAFDSPGFDLRVLEVEEQRGRANAHNTGAAEAKGEVLVFTDAETIFEHDFLSNIVKGYDDPKVGLISGELGWIGADATSVSSSMGLYWRYELALRRLESGLGMLAVGTGACISIRSSLYRPIFLTEDIDCVLPLEVLAKGFKVLSEPRAKAADIITKSVAGEIRARTRMVALDVVGFLRRKHLLNPFKHPGISLSIFSHKLLRWLSPFFIIINLFSCWALAGQSSAFTLLCYFNLLLIMLGFLGYVLEIFGKRIFPASQIFTFIVANIGFFLGLLTALRGVRISKYSSAESTD